MNEKTLKILNAVLTVASVGVTLALGAIGIKQRDIEIEKKVIEVTAKQSK